MRKRAILYIFTVFLMLISAKNSVSAAETKRGLVYKTVNNEVVITGYKGLGKKVVIPEMLGRKPVTKIASKAFYNSAIEKVTLPNSLKEIDKRAFYSCYNLSKVTFGKGLVSIGSEAFFETSLGDVDLGDRVECIENNAFARCASLTSVSLPKSLSKIGEEGIFSDCDNLEHIECDPSNEHYMAKDDVLSTKDGKTLIFYGAGNHADTYNVADGVERLKGSAFASNEYLKNINIPNSVVEIEDLFESLPNVETLNVLPDHPKFASMDGVLFTKNMKALYLFPSGRVGTYTVPDKTEIINKEAFLNSKLTKIILPDTVKKLKEGALNGTANLRSIKLSKSIQNYEGSIFGGSGIRKIEFPEGAKRIDKYVCIACNDLKEVVLPATVIKCGDGINGDYNTFLKGCNKIEKFRVKKGNKHYYSMDGILMNRKKDTVEVYPPAKKGKQYTFVKKVNLHNGAFLNLCFLKKVVFKKGFTYGWDAPFIGCKNLTVVTKEKVKKHGKVDLFSRCDKCKLVEEK